MIRLLDGPRPAFLLRTAHTAYALAVTPAGHLEHLHYGAALDAGDADGLTEQHAFPVGNACAYSREFSNLSLEDLRLEVSARGKGDLREPMVELVHADGSDTCDFRFEGYETGVGDPGAFQLPAAYDEDGADEWLKLRLRDAEYGVALTLTYRVFADCDVIVRRASLENAGGEPVRVERLLSCCLDFDPGDYVLTSFGGAWAREMRRADVPLRAGKQVVSSETGTSSNRANPFVMLSEAGCGEDFGRCWGFNLVYSGNHYECAEVSPYGKVRFVSGVNPARFSWLLAPGEALDAPEAVLSYSEAGFNGLSQGLHRFVREHIVRGLWKHRVRPVLLNSWEAAYFNISEARLLRLARAAKSVGIELLVMDDGWFGHRDDDTSSLGDWTPNPKKLPEGVKGLADKVRALGLDFGIWVEPEMVSEDSELYRAHPDWAIRIPGRPHSEGRNQMLLDLGRREVQDYLLQTLGALFSSAEISYVKWDMNRVFSDCWSPALPPERQGETAHRYVLGLYRVLDTLTRRFPSILFEGCAAGGNRFDLGALCFFPQIWASDNTDALCRAEIQTGYSYGYPMSCVSAHVSDVPNHQTLRRTPADTRFHVAAFGVLGYECSLCDLSGAALQAVRAQVALYKQWRETLQFGRFYRGRTFGPGGQSFLSGGGNTVEWTVLSPAGDRGWALLAQGAVRPNTPQAILHPKGLKPEAHYHIRGQTRRDDLLAFGSLVNYVAPFHVKPDGAVHKALAKAVKLAGETEDHHMTGSALLAAGLRLRPAFPAGGYMEDLRFFPDYASRIYFIEEEGAEQPDAH